MEGQELTENEMLAYVERYKGCVPPRRWKKTAKRPIRNQYNVVSHWYDRNNGVPKFDMSND